MNWLERFFRGSGRLPERERALLEYEGLVFLEEGVPATVSYHRYRAPMKRASGREATAAAIAASRSRLLVWISRGDMRGKNINIGFAPELLSMLDIRFDPPDRIAFGYDLARFHENRSGQIEVRLRTPSAAMIAQRLNELRYGGATGSGPGAG